MSMHVDDLRRVANLRRNDRITIAKDDVLSLLDDYAALEASIAELEKDASRYRWLLNCGTPNLWRKCGNMDSFDDVEKEIDEAMSREA